MARTAGGSKDLAWAHEQAAKARSTDELRQAQAILIPLELGLSLNTVRLSTFALSLSKGEWASTSSARTANRTVLG